MIERLAHIARTVAERPEIWTPHLDLETGVVRKFQVACRGGLHRTASTSFA